MAEAQQVRGRPRCRLLSSLSPSSLSRSAATWRRGQRRTRRGTPRGPSQPRAVSPRVLSAPSVPSIPMARSASRRHSGSHRPPPALGHSVYIPTLRPHPGLSPLPRTPAAPKTLGMAAGSSDTPLPTPACRTHRKRRNLLSRRLSGKLPLSFLRSAKKSLRSQIHPPPPPGHLCRSPHSASLMIKVVFCKGSGRRGGERPFTWEVHGGRGGLAAELVRDLILLRENEQRLRWQKEKETGVASFSPAHCQ